MQKPYQPQESDTEKPALIHENIMEFLVQQEIENQLKDCYYRLKPYINKVEVATFALNHLPTLYASTIDGKNHQMKLAKKYRQQIMIAVRRGIAAVERDPLRSSKPIISETEVQYQKAQKALQELQQFLQERNLLILSYLSWGNLVMVIHQALKKASWQQQQKF